MFRSNLLRGNLLRGGGVVILLAGILRGIASFIPTNASAALHSFYFVIDSLLLLSIIGLYIYLRSVAGRWSFPGFLLGLIGAVLLLVHDLVDSLGNLYALAALLFALGVTILALVAWNAKALPRWATFLLIMSTVVGSLGYFVNGLNVLFVLSGVLFGLGFIGAGLKMCLEPSSSPASVS